jgi:hypothetical protein
MKKIPTVFVRDEHDRSKVTDVVTPGCEWVLDGEGVPTRKYDGTCVLIRRDGMIVLAYARREVKPGKQPPPHFWLTEYDATTGKSVGWEPADQSGFARFINEALEVRPAIGPGTYELVGPKINGNPEGFSGHRLIYHANADLVDVPDRSFVGLRSVLLSAEWPGWEGIVFHHPDGRMAKIKRRDF